MKKLLLFMTLIVMAVSAKAQQRGDMSVGTSVGYGFGNKSMYWGIDYNYSITDAFRIAPSFTYQFKNHGRSAAMIDADAQYLIPLTEMVGFYPLAGLSLSFWDLPLDINKTRFGVNLGLGAEIYASDIISVGVEVKYNFIKSFDQVMAGVRLAYRF